MYLIDEIVDGISSKLLNSYKYDIQSDPLNIKTLYKSKLGLIKCLYKDAFYWHGTGRYHYQCGGKSKYHEKTGSGKIDVLESIIKHEGIVPQYDFWTKMRSVSLTKNRIYARAYAQFHQHYNKLLQYEYGTTKFWYFVFGVKQVFTNDYLHNIYRILNMLHSKDFNRKFAQWGKYVRKGTKRNPKSLLSFYKLRSDIRENYGILFGIKKTSVKEKKYNPTIERFEVRSINPIKFKD